MGVRMLKLASAGVAAATLLVASLLASCSPQESATGEPVAAAPQHPDFSGLWFPAGRQQMPQQPVYTPAAQEALAAYQAAFTLDDDPGRYCIWPGMPRAVWGAPFTVEIQQRPQDISIYWEGYGMYRKIYMADHSPPEPMLPSAMGHSVAHWEGDVLVIETTSLKQYPYMTRQATSSDAQLVERMRIEERDVDGQKVKHIVNELVLTDPKVYTTPIEITATLRHRPDLQLLEYTCTDALWDEYLAERGLALPDVDSFPAPQAAAQ
jgi:hypothetical protein